MKNFLLFALVTALITISSCSKESTTNAIVVRDCTGTYLTIDTDDYYVCNAGEIAQYDNGTKLNIKYKSVSECGLSVTCLLYHPKKGDIEVTDVK